MKKKIAWNKTNTIILGIMIVVVAGIGHRQESNVAREEKTTIETDESVITDDDVITDTDVIWKDMVQRSVVHVAAENYMGSGLIWQATKEAVVVATSRHLIDTAQTVTVEIAGVDYPAQIIGRSPQYDVAFLEIMNEELPEGLMAVKIPASEKEWQESTYLGTDVWQYSAAEKEEEHTGYIVDETFVAEFNCELLVTKCYVKAGMSGGGVFDAEGTLLGMIVGGATANEAEETYSLSSWIIEKEYENLLQNRD